MSSKNFEAERIRLLQELHKPDPELVAAEKELRALQERISGMMKETQESRKRSAKLEKEIEVLEKKRVAQAAEKVLLEEKGKKLEEELGPLRDRAATSDNYKKEYERMVGLYQSAQKKMQVVQKSGEALYNVYTRTSADNEKLIQKIIDMEARKKQLMQNEKNWKKYFPLLFALLDEVDSLVPINEETKKMKADVAALLDPALRERLIGSSAEHEAMARQVEMLISGGLEMVPMRAKSAKTTKITREEKNAEMKSEKFAKMDEKETEVEMMTNGGFRASRGKSVATTKIAKEEVEAEMKRKYAKMVKKEEIVKMPPMTRDEKIAWFFEEKRKIDERAAKKDSDSMMAWEIAELDTEAAEKEATAECQDDEPMPLQNDDATPLQYDD